MQAQSKVDAYTHRGIIAVYPPTGMTSDLDSLIKTVNGMLASEPDVPINLSNLFAKYCQCGDQEDIRRKLQQGIDEQHPMEYSVTEHTQRGYFLVRKL